MRAIVYKLLKEKAKKESLLGYDLNDPDTAEVVWQSCSDESENEDYPNVSVGILSIIAEHESEDTNHDIPALAALSAANFGAVNAMAQIVGEQEFSILFNKGEKENIHYSRVLEEFLLVCVFDNEVSLGLLRLKVAKAIGKIVEILES